MSKKEFITNKDQCTDNIYYMQDDDKKIISIDTYSMELEAKHKLKKLYPNYKIESVYIT
tara:strand:+ start:1167 stop:1343 length:177 start_codon:yes stop_codon:yes gene_type:complete